MVQWVKLLPSPASNTAHSHWVSFLTSISIGWWSLISIDYLQMTSCHVYTVRNKISSSFRVSEVLQAEKWLHQKEADHESVEPLSLLKGCISSSWSLSWVSLWETLRPTQLESRLIWCGRDSRLHTSLTSSLFELLSPPSEPLCLHHVFFPWEEKHSSDHHHLISFPLFSPPMATFF